MGQVSPETSELGDLAPVARDKVDNPGWGVPRVQDLETTPCIFERAVWNDVQSLCCVEQRNGWRPRLALVAVDQDLLAVVPSIDEVECREGVRGLSAWAIMKHMPAQPHSASPGTRRRIPRWAPLSLTIIGSAGLFVLTVAPRGHGATKWILVVLSVLLVIAGPIGTELASRVSADEARLRVDVELSQSVIGLPSLSNWDGPIEVWLDSVRSRLLASLPQDRERLPSDEGKVKARIFGLRERGSGATIRELKEYERRDAAGESLTPEEEAKLRHGRETMERFRNVVAAQAFLIPDKRTEEDFRDEVEHYIDAWREALHARVESEYKKQELGVFRISITNPTEKTFEGVQIEVTLTGKCRAVLDIQSESETDIPVRPRPFGQRTPAFTTPNLWIPPAVNFPRLSVDPPSRPKIEDGDQVSITYPPVTLRADGGHTNLEAIHLFSYEPPGSSTMATWEATAKNGDGRVRGTLQVGVGPPMDFGRILGWADAAQSA